MDLQSGKFKAPISGFYFFSFSGMAYDKDSYLFTQVKIYKNGETYTFLEDYNGKKGDGVDGYDYQSRTIASSWSSKLVKGDTINLQVSNGQSYVDSDVKIIFNGQLMMKSDE